MSKENLATLKNLELLLLKAKERSPKSDRIDQLTQAIKLVKEGYIYV